MLAGPAAAAAALALLPAVAGAIGAPQARDGRGSFDARDAAAAAPVTVPASRQRAADTMARRLGREARVELDPATGTPRVVARTDGALTAPSAAAPARTALDWVRDHPGLFGLDAADLAALGAPHVVVTPAGVTILRWTQSFRGVPVAGAELRANVAPDGSLISVQGAPLADTSVPSTTPALSASAALRRARGDAGARSSLPRTRSAAPGARRATEFADDSVASLVVSPGKDGNRLAWSVRTRIDSTHVYQYLLDARDGRVLQRHNLVRWAASGDAWSYAPSPAVASNGGDVQRPRPFGDDWVYEQSALFGNNAWAYSDAYDDNNPFLGDDPDPADQVPARVVGADLAWDYPFQPQTTGGCALLVASFPCSWSWGVEDSWRVNREQSAVQAFWFVNTFADHLREAPIGFDERSGNFQLVNRTSDGRDNDLVFVETSDGAGIADGLPDQKHLNNANMYTPPDGEAPAMQMYLFGSRTDGVVNGNGGDDAAVVYHEYTHGLSSRLITGPDGVQALNTPQSGAMGEAWSDWYALDFLVGDDPSRSLQVDTPGVDGEIVLAAYLSGGVNWLRDAALDCSVGTVSANCPRGGFTYADYGNVWTGGPEVHADGEIWAQTLWQLRTALIAAHGEAGGVERARQLITEGMRLTPGNPNFLDARDAILAVDANVNASEDRALIWSVFAERGMGFYAATSSGADPAPVADFSEPPAPGAPTTLRGTVTDAQDGSPLAGATVALPGPGAPSTTTGPDGRYAITAVAGAAYPRLLVARAGFDAPEGDTSVTVAGDGSSVRDVALRRNWALRLGGAAVLAGVDPDLGEPCAAENAIDGALAYGWASYAPTWDGIDGDPPSRRNPNGQFPDSTRGPRSIVVQLPRAVDVSAFTVDPGAICGDDDSASVGELTVETSPDGQPSTYSPALTATFDRNARPSPNHRLHVLTPAAGTIGGVRYVRITMVRPQGGPGDSDERFMDLAEFGIRGTATPAPREEPREEPREQPREEPRPQPREEPRADTRKPRATLKLVAPKTHGLTVLRGRAGMPLKVRFDEQTRVAATVTLPAATARRLGLTTRRSGTFTLTSARVSKLAANRVATVRLKLGSAARRRLASTRSLRITVTVTATDAAGNATKLVFRPLLKR